MTLCLRLLWRFGDYRYFREIADFMKLKVPLINHEIQIDHNLDCLVHGLKRIDNNIGFIQHSAEAVDSLKPQTSETNNEATSQSKVQSIELQQSYVFQQNAESMLKFNRALTVSKDLGMDLCLIRSATEQRSPILSVSWVCKHVYSQYYHAHIKRKGKNEFKAIRLSDRISEHDIQFKYQNLKRMHEAGERKFRLEATNDSEKAEKVLKEFAKLFGKRVEPYLKTFKFAPRFIPEQRWVCNLFFEEEVDVDPRQVNKKWRSYKFQQTYHERNPADLDEENFENQSLEMQRELYEAYKQLKMKLPPKFQQAANLEAAMKTDKHALFKSAAEDEDEVEWDEQEQTRYAQQQAKFNRTFFGERTIDEILTEMQQLKSSGYESQAHKVARFRQLKAELDQKLKSQDEDI